MPSSLWWIHVKKYSEIKSALGRSQTCENKKESWLGWEMSSTDTENFYFMEQHWYTFIKITSVHILTPLTGKQDVLITAHNPSMGKYA